MRLNDETTVALAKAVKAAALKQARNELRPGSYIVDTTIRLKGTMIVGEDETYTPTTHLPVTGVMALILRHCGVTRQSAINAVDRVASDALANFGSVGVACDEAGEWMKDLTRKVCDMTERLPKATRIGKVRTELEATLVA